jgi:hypothetical protein
MGRPLPDVLLKDATKAQLDAALDALFDRQLEEEERARKQRQELVLLYRKSLLSLTLHEYGDCDEADPDKHRDDCARCFLLYFETPASAAACDQVEQKLDESTEDCDFVLRMRRSNDDQEYAPG